MDEYHYEDEAEDVYEFISQLGLEEPAYYGWSDGGIIGLILEINHPGTVSSLAISGTNLYPSGAKTEILEWILEDYAETRSPLDKQMLLEPTIDVEDVATIETPTLVLAGSEDVIKQEHTELIANTLQNSTLYIVDGEDHGSYIEGSEIAGELLLDWLKEQNY